MKRVTIIGIILLTSFVSKAEPVKEMLAHQVARHFASGYATTPLRTVSDLELVYTATMTSDLELRATDSPLFYVYNLSDDAGFVIVSGDDVLDPILAYSDKNSFKVDNMPDNLKNWLLFYEKEILYAINNNYTGSEEIRRKWESLSAGTYHVRSNGVLLSTALWDQLEPYNSLCPVYSGEKTVAGCIATSMAIIMKYYGWPLQGKGSKSYTTETNKIQVNTDLNISYDWDNMLDEYLKTPGGSPRWNEIQENAVATLIYHAGVASGMDYDTKSSGAYDFDAVMALINNFGYDKSMYMAYRELYTTEEWHELLQTELNEGRPLLYGGVTSAIEGHQFILDGYNANYYHVNWGWSGYANGYYLLSSLLPNWQGTGGSAEGEGFALEQSALLGVKKEQADSNAGHELYFLEKEVVESSSLPRYFDVYGLSTDEETIEVDKPFTLYFSYIMDYGMRDFEGVLGLFVVDKDGNKKETLAAFSADLKSGSVIYSMSSEYKFTITTEIEEGDKIVLYYSSDMETWKPVRGKINTDTVTELPIWKTSVGRERVLEKPQTVRVSVNQSESVIYIQSESQQPFTRVKVIDMSGRLLKEQKCLSGETNTSISIKELKTGVYIVAIETVNGWEKHKIYVK